MSGTEARRSYASLMRSLAAAVRRVMDRFAADLRAPLADAEAAGALTHANAHTHQHAQSQGGSAAAEAGGGGEGSRDSFWSRALAGLPFSRCGAQGAALSATHPRGITLTLGSLALTLGSLALTLGG